MQEMCAYRVRHCLSHQKQYLFLLLSDDEPQIKRTTDWIGQKCHTHQARDCVQGTSDRLLHVLGY